MTTADKPMRERVTRPGGKVWVHTKGQPRRVMTERAAIVVTHTHNPQGGRERVAERWAELFPDHPLPRPTPAWRRTRTPTYGKGRDGRTMPVFDRTDADPNDPNAYPVLAYAFPEGTAPAWKERR